METVGRTSGRMEIDGGFAVEYKRVRILRPELLAEMCAEGGQIPRNVEAGQSCRCGQHKSKSQASKRGGAWRCAQRRCKTQFRYRDIFAQS